jgi:hypothetical protein
MVHQLRFSTLGLACTVIAYHSLFAAPCHDGRFRTNQKSAGIDGRIMPGLEGFPSDCS